MILQRSLLKYWSTPDHDTCEIHISGTTKRRNKKQETKKQGNELLSHHQMMKSEAPFIVQTLENSLASGEYDEELNATYHKGNATVS